MTFSMKRTLAIFQKDYKDLLKNYYITITIVVPLVLAALYSRMGADSIDIHYFVFNMAFSMVTAFIQCALIAEEKEKNTLRGLMLSPASMLEILSGKSLLTFIGTIIIIAASAFFLEYKPANLLIIAIAMILSIIFYIALGTLLGLLTKSVMEASIIILPVILIFSLGSLITSFMDKYPILQVAEYLPNLQLVDLAAQVQSGAGFMDVWSNLAIIFAWVVASYALVMIVYKKRMMD